MKIKLASVFVDDQEKALRFYTEILGFRKQQDIPAGKYRWLTIVSPEDPDGTQLVLEPMAHAVAQTYQEGIFKAGIPATSFEVDDVQKEYERLSGLGVAFRTPPTAAGPTVIAVFEDTCGNLIGIHQA